MVSITRGYGVSDNEVPIAYPATLELAGYAVRTPGKPSCYGAWKPGLAVVMS